MLLTQGWQVERYDHSLNRSFVNFIKPSLHLHDLPPTFPGQGQYQGRGMSGTLIRVCRLNIGTMSAGHCFRAFLSVLSHMEIK